MGVRVRLDWLESSSGDRIQIPHAGVTCIVGGNNVGKSQGLRDTLALLQEPNASPIVITDIGLVKPAIDESVAVEYLTVNAARVPKAPGSVVEFTPIGGGQNLNVKTFVAHYAHPVP